MERRGADPPADLSVGDPEALKKAPSEQRTEEALPFPVAWDSMNFTDWTNMPADPQQGSKTRPSYGSIISTSSLTTEAKADEGYDPEQPDEYSERNVFWVPPQ